MIYQPRNVQPSGVSIDGLLDNTFTMEIQTNSYVSAYQLLIVDFNNNEIYTGSKTTLTNYAYNGDTLEIPVNASTVALSNGINYKWRVRLYQPTADMLITYGLVQSTSTTTTIYLQPNINIKAGMAITINSQTKTISSYNSDTGVAVVSSAFSSAPAVGTQYKIYSDFIETVPDYIVYARRTPAVAISNVPSSLTLKYHTFQGTYTQSDNVAIVYHQFDLYTRNDDGTISLVASSDKVYSANLSYTYDSFRTGNEYLIQMTVENDMGIISTTDMYEFTVSYDIVEYLQQPLASFDNKNNAVKVSWVTPVENEATSLRSDAATGIIQDNNNTLTQATFEPGQSIGEGDVVQITNSNCELVIEGKSEQETSVQGKNYYTGNKFTNGTGLGITYNFDNSIIKLNGTTTGNGTIYEASTKIKIPAGTYSYALGLKSGIFTTNDKDIAIYLRSATDFITGTYSTSGHSLKAIESSTIKRARRSFTIEQEVELYVRLYTNGSGVVCENVELELQLEAGSTTTDFEQFVPNSPSPDYPSEIESVGYINLFDGIMEDGSYRTTDGDKITSAGTRRNVTPISVRPNTTYIISNNGVGVGINVLEYDSSKNFIKYTNSAAIQAGASFTTSDNTAYINIFRSSSNTDKIQIETGKIIHHYIPYNKYGMIVKTIGENLIGQDNLSSLSNATAAFNNNSILYTSVGTYRQIMWFIPVKKGDVITLNAEDNEELYYGLFECSVDFSTSENYVLFKHKWSVPFTNLPVTVTIQNDCFLRLYIGSSVATTQTIINLQLQKGAIATKYEDYKEQTSIIQLNAPLRGISESICDVYKHNSITRKVGRIVLNGSEDWGVYNNQYYTLKKTFFENANLPAYTTNLLCNYFKIVNQSTTTTSIGTIYLGTNNINFNYDDGVGGVDNFKTWLSTHNVELLYELLEPINDVVSETVIPQTSGTKYINIYTNLNTTFKLEYPHKTITDNTCGYTEFNPPGVKQTGTIKSYNAITGVGTLMTQYPFTYIPMQGDSYIVISNIYNVSGFSYLYNTPYNTVNSLYTHGYTATWSTPDGLCVLPDDFNITLQFSPDGNFFYDQNGVYQEVVDLITTETDGASGDGEFTIKIDKNKLIFVQNPDISLELPFYTNTSQVFVLSSANIAQINNDYIWDDTATWTDTYTWVEGGTSLERVCNHWWKVQITNTGIKIEEIFPTT